MSSTRFGVNGAVTLRRSTDQRSCRSAAQLPRRPHHHAALVRQPPRRSSAGRRARTSAIADSNSEPTVLRAVRHHRRLTDPAVSTSVRRTATEIRAYLPDGLPRLDVRQRWARRLSGRPVPRHPRARYRQDRVVGLGASDSPASASFSRCSSPRGGTLPNHRQLQLRSSCPLPPTAHPRHPRRHRRPAAAHWPPVGRSMCGLPASPACLPVGVTAVVLNVTATESAQAGFVTAYPSDTRRPTVSNLNVDGRWADRSEPRHRQARYQTATSGCSPAVARTSSPTWPATTPAAVTDDRWQVADGCTDADPRHSRRARGSEGEARRGRADRSSRSPGTDQCRRLAFRPSC